MNPEMLMVVYFVKVKSENMDQDVQETEHRQQCSYIIHRPVNRIRNEKEIPAGIDKVKKKI